MSYNNYVDVDAAWRAASDFADPAVAIIKHANPCGIAAVAGGATMPVALAHQRAHACDPVSAFGGVIAVNRPVTAELAEQIAEVFTEVLLAPGFSDEALEHPDPEEEHPAAGDAGRTVAPDPGGVPGDLRRPAGADAGPDRRARGRSGDLDAGGRTGGRRRDPGRPRLRLAGLPFGEVERDPAGPGRRQRRASAWGR